MDKKISDTISEIVTTAKMLKERTELAYQEVASAVRARWDSTYEISVWLEASGGYIDFYKKSIEKLEELSTKNEDATFLSSVINLMKENVKKDEDLIQTRLKRLHWGI